MKFTDVEELKELLERTKNYKENEEFERIYETYEKESDGFYYETADGEKEHFDVFIGGNDEVNDFYWKNDDEIDRAIILAYINE